MECNQNTQFQEYRHFVVIKNYVYKDVKQMDIYVLIIVTYSEKKSIKTD